MRFLKKKILIAIQLLFFYFWLMNTESLQLFMADDDKDDCFLFAEALKEIPISTQLTTARDGEKLMQLLTKQNDENLPDVIFLDLNMPRKNGFQCLNEIKHNDRLKEIPVIIFSTYFQDEIVELLYKNGAQHCMRKPVEFTSLKKIVHCVLDLTLKERAQPEKKDFMIR
jgi:CheY-like chemotaxis protein